jgi:hypothetical protein
MKQSQFYYLLRRGLLKSMSVVREGLVMFNKFTTAGISHPAQGSAEFDGASDYIELPADVLTDFSEFTFCSWFYHDGQTSNDSILSFGLSTDSSKLINFETISAADGLQILYRPTGGESPLNISGLQSQMINKWNFFVATKNGATQKIYLNGSQIATTSSGSTTQPSPAFDRFSIGVLRRDTLINYWDGNLANVAIWNRALSSDEINSVMWKGYDALEASEKNGLQAWYSLDDVASPSASLATMEALAVDKDATIENKAAITAAINALS